MTKKLEKMNSLPKAAIYQSTPSSKQYRFSTWIVANLNLINENIKYFAIIPAIIGSFLALGNDPHFLNHLSHFVFLSSPWSAVLSIFTFNCCLLAIFLWGKLRSRLNPVTVPKKINFLYTYGLVLAITSFLSIKLIDLFISALGIY
ncbi:MAG: hypothetical protein ACSNEK_07260 [Parachlamydiaceae bacterium]